jgi:hypothetical protein
MSEHPTAASAISKWEVLRRLEEIERHIFWRGSVGRNELMQRFGTSLQLSSSDFKLYKLLNPDGLIFNSSTKRYEAAPDFTPCLFTPSLDDYLAWDAEVSRVPSLETVPAPLRRVDTAILREITLAIHRQQVVEIRYQSLSNPIAAGRRLAPHTLVFDGKRYHVRGWCFTRSAFRDFVLGRILSVSPSGGRGPGRDEDQAWHTLVVVRLGPHPDFSPAQRQVIEHDYGMVNGEVQIRVRQAMLLYLLNTLRLDEEAADRPPEVQQVVLLNPEVRTLVN